MVIFHKKVEGLSEQSLEKFVSRARKAAGLGGTVDVVITGNSAMRTLNLRFRGKNKATDVLSFPSGQAGAKGRGTFFAGEIAISAEIAAENAMRFGHSIAAEVKILALHGILHLAGMDHERDNGVMARKEASLRKLLTASCQSDPACGTGRIVQRAYTQSSDRKGWTSESPEEGMTFAVAVALVLLMGVLTLVSYVDRVYQELGKFLSREFQDNIDVFEQKIEPKLSVGRRGRLCQWPCLRNSRWRPSRCWLAFFFFSQPLWGIYEVLQAAVSLLLIVIVCNRFLPFVFFSRTKGEWLRSLDITGEDLLIYYGHAGDTCSGISLSQWPLSPRENTHEEPETSG